MEKTEPLGTLFDELGEVNLNSAWREGEKWVIERVGGEDRDEHSIDVAPVGSGDDLEVKTCEVSYQLKIHLPQMIEMVQDSRTIALVVYVGVGLCPVVAHRRVNARDLPFAEGTLTGTTEEEAFWRFDLSDITPFDQVHPQYTDVYGSE